MADIVKGLAAAGLSFLPGAGQVAAFVEVAYPNADKEWKALATSEYQDMVHGLQERVNRLEEALAKHGKRLDDLGPLRTRRLVVDWAEAVREAEGETKRNSVSNAAARQFDPDWHTVDVRKYWFDQVTQLSDLEVRAIQMLGVYDYVAFAPSSGTLLFGSKGVANGEEASDSLSVALGASLSELKKRAIVGSPNMRIRNGNEATETFGISGRSRALLEAIAEIP